MQKSVLGLDIGEDFLSAVLIKSSFKTNRIVGHRHIGFDSSKEDFKQVLSDFLGDICKTLSLKNTSVTISIPAGRVFFRTMKAPFKNRNKIRQMLPYELETELPVPVENLLIDFLSVSTTGDHLLIAAALEKKFFKDVLNTLEKSGIEPVKVTPAGFDIVCCLVRFTRLPEQVLILHTDRFSATLYSVIAKEITSIRSFRIPPEGPVRIKILTNGIRQMILASKQNFSMSFSPEGILITGSPGDFEELENALNERFDISIRGIDLVRETDISQSSDNLKWCAHHLNNAFASALAEIYGFRELNFRKNSFGSKTFWRKHKASLIKTGALAAAVFLIFLMNFFTGNRLMEKRLAQLEGKVESIFRSTFPETSRIEDAVLQMRIKLREARGKDSVSPESQKRIRAIDILNEISKRIPENADVDFGRLVLGMESVQFSGSVGNFKTINDIQNRLERIPFFKNVMITTATVDRSGNRVRFKINADLSNP